jgi:hypothetical protein
MPGKIEDHGKDELAKKAKELAQQLRPEYTDRDIRRIGGYLCQIS